jgi:YHS domain-containing protein
MELVMSRTLSRRSLAFGLAFGLAAVGLGMPAPAFAYDPASPNPLNLDKTGLALRGYDPVSYFTDGKPTFGKAEFAATHDGATYHFSSAAHRDLFLAEPGKYVPAYGGFCAYGLTYSKKVDTDPKVWKIVEGKLYLNVNPSVGKTWEKEAASYIDQANGIWPKIRDRKPGEL